MAGLGAGLLIIPQQPWNVVENDFQIYHKIFREENGCEAPPPLCGGFYFVDESADRAEEMAHKYIGDYYQTAMNHYEMTAEHFGKAKVDPPSIKEYLKKVIGKITMVHMVLLKKQTKKI